MEHTIILGISAYYHDSAAALVVDGEIIAAAQEERFSRIKHDSAFPEHVIRYIKTDYEDYFNNLTAVVFYDKPMLKFERLLVTYHSFAPRGILSFIKAIPVWLKEKLFMQKTLRDKLRALGIPDNTKLLFSEHHLSHAASAFYPSPFTDAAILTIDGVGEWATAAIAKGDKNGITMLKEMRFPHSVGLLYSSFTYFLGFKVNDGEYKLMGLAPYGDPEGIQTRAYREKIDRLVDIREDGSIVLNMDYFNFAVGLTMINHRKWQKLFGIPRRKPESPISPAHTALAFAAQSVLEEIVLCLARTARSITGCSKLVMAGGVALNCRANTKIATSGIFDDIWIQPASGDAGGALGAALSASHIFYGIPRPVYPPGKDGMKNAFLGNSFSGEAMIKFLDGVKAKYTRFEYFEELAAVIARALASGKIVGWFNGRMEFGPRALGNRSILADARNPDMQRRMNEDVKFRETFRPFAPVVLEEDLSLYFPSARCSDYMLFISEIGQKWRLPYNYPDADDIYARLYSPRSSFPAVTHVDFSARIQTVSRESNPDLWLILRAFKEITGVGMLLNTSFNVRGEPIVCSPEDAYCDFLRSGVDLLGGGGCLVCWG